MLLLAIGLVWCVTADMPSQLLILATAILLRILYVTGRPPSVPRDLLAFWVIALILGYILAPAQFKERVLLTFCTLTLLGTLIIHVTQQALNSGFAQRIPGVRHIALFFSRYMVLGQRVSRDMKFWSQQTLREERARRAHQTWVVRGAAIAFVYAGSRVSIFTGLIHDARSLIEKWSAILDARGGLPSYKLSMATAKHAPRRWYADLIADVVLATMILLPLSLDNDVLIPSSIVAAADALMKISSW